MKNIFACLVTLWAGQTLALDAVQSPALERLFKKAGVTGTFVLYDVSAEHIVVHNLPRAEQRFIPASTFKIPNSLIGLSTGAVDSVDEVLPYGGKAQYFKSWEQDMGLRDAIKISNVPVYQELARRVGADRMRKNLAAIPYGNFEIGSEIDTFWLKGPLEISAIEQAKFLARLAQGTLPFPPDAQRAVREIVQLEHRDDRTLYGKTGWTTTPDPDLGWWVGWVTIEGSVFSFALNIDMPDRSDVAKRVDLGRACLKELEIF